MPGLLVLACALVLAACSNDIAHASSGTGELRFSWDLPPEWPAQVSLHRSLPGQETSQIRTYPAGQPPALGEEIVGGVLPVRLDEPQRVVVSVRNPLDHPVRFWVVPHLPTPHDGQDALMVSCLCTGETYEVPAGGTWTRVLEFGIRRRGAVTPLRITHLIVLGDAPAVNGP